MAKLSYPLAHTKMQLFATAVCPDTTSNDTLEQKQMQQVQQLQVLLSVARIRRRSQRQLLVQIEQEQHSSGRKMQSLPPPRLFSEIETSTEISRSCSRTILEDVDDSDEVCFDEGSVTSSNSISSDAVNS